MDTTQTTPEYVTMDTTKGTIRGVIDSDVMVFKGIPYAKPPVGELRFAPPVEMDHWSGEKDCLEFGHCAIQTPSILINTTPSEDCLYLNVWAPAHKSAKKYPVFFWIHGGGFFNGCGTMPYYDGMTFAQNDIILVTINYRLGALGFLALDTLRKTYGTTGNWGTLDMIAALRWTWENIGNFGGDSTNITIGGESAGAFAVTNLIMSPLARGLFQKAITESGNILSNAVSVPLTKAQLQPSIEVSGKVAQAFGADDSPEGLEILRKADPLKLWETAFFSSDVTVACPLALWPVQDGVVIPTDPLQSLANGEYNHVQYLMGFNKDEGNVFIGQDSTEEGAQRYCQDVFGANYGQVKAHYDQKGMTMLQAIPNIVENAYFRSGTIQMMDMFVKGGDAVYGYQFNYVPDGNYPMKMLGAHHAVEILFVFDSIVPAGLQEGQFDGKVSRQMHDMWCNFIAEGNPNEGLDVPSPVEWKGYEAPERALFYIDKQMSCEPLEEKSDIQFFQELLYGSEASLNHR